MLLEVRINGCFVVIEPWRLWLRDETLLDIGLLVADLTEIF
jgi:hypothetical protein